MKDKLIHAFYYVHAHVYSITIFNKKKIFGYVQAAPDMIELESSVSAFWQRLVAAVQF